MITVDNRVDLWEKTLEVISDVVLAKEVWERTQKGSHFKSASNSF